MAAVVELLTDAAFALSPLAAYLPQYFTIRRTKSDGFSPLGPYLVTTDEAGDPHNLEIRCFVNGELRQHSNTSDMIFPCDEIVSYISRHMTLGPGDIILTGTPEGVVLGYPPEKQVYLKPGDEVTIEIEKLGALTNRFVAE